MPRVSGLENAYKIKDLYAYIMGQMDVRGIKQFTLATTLGLSQQSVSRKLRERSFSVPELMEVFEVLKTSNEKIGELLGGRK